MYTFGVISSEGKDDENGAEHLYHHHKKESLVFADSNKSLPFLSRWALYNNLAMPEKRVNIQAGFTTK